MKIALLTYGSRGDVEPFVALGEGLAAAGHRVCLAAPQVYDWLAAAAGLEWVGLPGDVPHLVEGLTGRAGRGGPGAVLAVSRYVLPLAARVLRQLRVACQGADVIVHSFLLTTAGHEVARQLGRPDLSAHFFPVFASTAAFPSPGLPDLPLGCGYRRLTHWVTTQVFWQGSRLLYGWLRRRQPGWPALSGWPFSAANRPPTPLLYAYSPQVLPRPADWPAHAHVTGYWFPRATGNWQPPAALLDFLAAAPQPVAVTFGSTAVRYPRRLAALVCEALELGGQRGVLVGLGLPVGPVGRGLYALDAAPYGWLFPRVAAVVHHGGAGTTGQGLAAGVPNVVVPFASDQPFWGRQLRRLGVSPPPIPAARLSALRLAAALCAAVGDARMRERARSLGMRIRAEDGVARAVEIVLRPQ